eukprot:8185275-Pyramimonas_sp.AAC.1
MSAHYTRRPVRTKNRLIGPQPLSMAIYAAILALSQVVSMSRSLELSQAQSLASLLKRPRHW